MPLGDNKMASILFAIGGAVMNALAFSGTKFLLSKLMGHGEKNAKDMIWHSKSFKGPEMNRIKIECIMVCIGVSNPLKNATSSFFPSPPS